MHLCRRIGFYNWHVVDPFHVNASGIMLMWIAGMNVSTLFNNEGTIDVYVRSVARFAFVYGLQDNLARYMSLIEYLCQSHLRINHDSLVVILMRC